MDVQVNYYRLKELTQRAGDLSKELADLQIQFKLLTTEGQGEVYREVRNLALKPGRKFEAICLYKKLYPTVTLAQAKLAVEEMLLPASSR